MKNFFLLWHIKFKDSHTENKVEYFLSDEKEYADKSLQKHIKEFTKKNNGTEVKDVILHQVTVSPR